MVLEPGQPALRHTLTSGQFRRMSGVDQLPRPKDPASLTSAVRLHDSGIHGAIVVDVTFDTSGKVEKVELPRLPSGTAPRILQGHRGMPLNTFKSVTFEHDPHLRDAAEAVLRSVEFTPALRDQEPVAYTMRMTIHFGPS